MIFDTGSNWLWVYSRICLNLMSHIEKFDERNSSTFSFYPAMYDLHYGSGDVYGYNAFDQVCITKEFCAPNFSFLIVNAQKNLYSLESSGIIGMSPNALEDRGDLFLLKMKEAGVID
jgi:hypothetical protein